MYFQQPIGIEFYSSVIQLAFNIKDPIFNIDVSFYVFKLPLIQSIYGVLVSLLAFLVFITFITYSILSAKDKIYSGRGLKKSFSKINLVNSGLTRFAGKQLAVISALIMICISIGYLLKALELVYSPRGVAFGASYTDVHVSLLFYKIIIVVSLIAAIVIFTSVLTSKVKPIVVSIGIIIVLVIGEGIVANAVQTFIVKSNEKTLEQPYIKYNIDYTRKAFNIEDIQAQPFEVKDNLTKEDIKNNKDTIDNIRINSYKPALEFYNQVQIIRYYYGFNDVDVDRYNINNK